MQLRATHSRLSHSKQRSSKHHHKHSTRPFVTCAASTGSDSKQHGWHWPFSKQTADDAETEIVYVTDTAEADEVIEEPEFIDILNDRQQEQQQAHGVLNASAAAQAAAEAALDADTPESSPQLAAEYDELQDVPEATAYASDPALHHQQHTQQASHSQGVPARPAFASSSLAVPVSDGYWSTSAGGWVVALSLLIAVRQGRAQADAARLDVRALQARQHESRVQSRELKEKRAQYLQQQQLLKEEAAAKRLAEQAREVEKARHEAAVKAVEYERTAKEELDIFVARRAAAKKAFEESQGKLEEELAARTAREIAIREEAEARRAAEEAARRAAAAAEAAREAAEAAAAAEAAERAASEAAAARASMKQQLRDSSHRYQLNLQGAAVAAPQAAVGRQPRLLVSLTIHPAAASSSSSDSSSSSTAAAAVAKVQWVYDSSDAATDGAAALAVRAAQQVYTHYAPAVAQGGGESAGLAASGGAWGVQLSDADDMLWRLLLLAKIETAGRQAIGQVAPLAASGELQQDLQAQLCYSALPQSNPNSLQQRLQQCADLASQQQLPAAIQLLDDIIEWQLEDFTSTNFSSSNSNRSSLAKLLQQIAGSGSCPVSPYVVPACVYAVLLNMFDPATQAINKRSSSSSRGTEAGIADNTAADTESSAVSPDSSRPGSPDTTAADDDDDMFDAVDSSNSGSSSSSSVPAALARRTIVTDRDSPLQRLAKFQLEQLEKAAPADELTPVSGCLRLLLGRKHPVAAAMQLLAERNMSPGARQARALRQQQRQLARATELLQGSAVAGPGGIDPQGARSRQQLVPAPERIWALRNVASSMLRSTASSGGGGGSSSSSAPSAEEAVSMLQQASDLAAEHYGRNHPGRLSALLDYIGALLVVPGHESEAKSAIEALCGIVAAVGERYRQQKDLLSLVLLYESTQAELDVPEVIGREFVAMTRLQRQAADAFGVLETAQANKVMSKRKLAPASSSTALRQLARDCTEQLGLYAAGKKRDTRLDQWNKNLPLAPLR